MTFSATLKGPLDSNGHQAIYIRRIISGKRKFFAVHKRINPNDWDYEKKRVKPSHPNHEAINKAIDKKVESIYKDFKETEDRFYEYAIKRIKEWEHTKKESTIKQLKSKVSTFNNQFPGIKLKDIGIRELTRFKTKLFNDGLKQNTVWTSLKVLRLFIRKAYREKLISENPFDVFEMPKYKNSQRNFLTKEQVDLIEEKLPELPKEYRQAAGWFLISCYTGLRYGDQATFDKKKIKNGRLIIYTSKTGQVVSMKMNDKLEKLFEAVEYKPVGIVNQQYNLILKAIGAICGIEETLTVHLARHTFGTLCASAGISQEVTAKLMGHSSIRTTAIYYQLTADRLDSEFEKLF